MDITKGLQLDGTYLDNDIGVLKHAKNIIDSEGRSGVENEPGFELSDIVDGTIMGICETSDKTILFSVIAEEFFITEHPRFDEHETHYGVDAFNFRALPGGTRDGIASFESIGKWGYFSIYEESSASGTYARQLKYNFGTLSLEGPLSKNYGSSVRLVRDATVLEQDLDDGTIISDIYTGNDGEVYEGVKIGLQIWIRHNLKETKYNDDTLIPTGLDNTAWSNDTTGAMTVYSYLEVDGLNNEAEVIDAYGRLYNWYALNNAKGLANPTDGWHIPLGVEWVQLIDYITVNYDWTSDDVGNALKSYTLVTRTFSEIGIFDGTTYTKILKTEHLNFSEDNPIRAQSTFNYLGELIVAWCDGTEDTSNEGRLLNIDNLPFNLDSNLELLNSNEIIHTKLYPDTFNIKTDLISITDGGGSLKSGVYYISVANITKDGGITEFSSISNPITVISDNTSDAYNNIEGSRSGLRTNKSFVINLSNLSLSYSILVVAVIYKENENLFCRITNPLEYNDTSKYINIADYDSLFDYDINEVLINNAVYPKFEDLSVNVNKLLINNLLGLEQIPNLNILGQQLANSVSVKWTHSTDEIDPTSNLANKTFKNPKYIFYNKHFRYNEVYALYLGLRSNKGGLIGTWHIPGRTSNSGDTDIVSELDSLNVGQVKKFQVKDTASSTGDLSYWENENESYNSEFPTYGGQKVRHHKMPSLNRILEKESPSYFDDPAAPVSPTTYDPGLYSLNWKFNAVDSVFPSGNYGEFKAAIPMSNGEFTHGSIGSNIYTNTKYTALNNHVFKIKLDIDVSIFKSSAGDLFPTVFSFDIEHYNSSGSLIEKIYDKNIDNDTEDVVQHYVVADEIDIYLQKGEYIKIIPTYGLRHIDDYVNVTSFSCAFLDIDNELNTPVLVPGTALFPDLNYLEFGESDASLLSGTFSSYVVSGNTLNNTKYTASSNHILKIKISALIQLKHVAGADTKFEFYIYHYNSSDILQNDPYTYGKKFTTSDGLDLLENHLIDYEEIQSIYLQTGDYLLLRGTGSFSDGGDIVIPFFNAFIEEKESVLYDHTIEAWYNNPDFVHFVGFNNTPVYPNLSFSDYEPSGYGVIIPNCKFTSSGYIDVYIKGKYDVDLKSNSTDERFTLISVNLKKNNLGVSTVGNLSTFSKQKEYDVLSNFKKEFAYKVSLAPNDVLELWIAIEGESSSPASNYIINNIEVEILEKENLSLDNYINIDNFVEVQEIEISNPSYTAYMDGVGELVNKNILLGLDISNVDLSVLPQSVLDIVDGWEIFYAKRDITNSTVISQSALIPDDWYDDGNIESNKSLRFHGFDLMYSKPDISEADYISVEGIINRRSNTEGIYDFRNIMNNQLQDRILLPLGNGDLSKTYVPVDNSSANNESREGTLKLYINSAIPTTDNFNNLGSNKIALVNLCNYRTDLYSGFQNQTLVSTGLVKNNNDTTAITLGGDTFFNRYAFRITYDDNEDSRKLYKHKRIIYLFTENSNNVDLRMSDELDEHKFYPYNSAEEILDIDNEFDNFINTVTGIGYNKDFTSLNDLIRPYINKSTDNFAIKFPYRIAISLPQRSESLELGWRKFKVDSYIDLPAKDGEIIGIYSFGRTLYIQQRYSLSMAYPKETITSFEQTAYLRQEDIFDRPPEPVVVSKNGYIGCESKFAATVSIYGYIVADTKKGAIFFVGEKPVEISSIGAKNWFKDNMAPLTTYNPFIGQGIFIAFNDIHKRFILTYKGVSEYTLSFTIDTMQWKCFHDYIPDYCFRDNSNTYFIKNYGNSNNRIFRSNVKTNRGIYLYPGVKAEAPIQSSFVDILINPDLEISKLIQSVYWQTVVKDSNRIVYEDTINKIMVYNETQCTGLLDVNVGNSWYHSDSGKYIDDIWYFNEVNDNVVNDRLPILDSELNPISSNVSKNLQNWFDISDFICKFVVVRLLYDNTSGRYILMRSIGLNMVKDYR